jgi:DNA-directed RNA polymerase III subunit RPC4
MDIDGALPPHPDKGKGKAVSFAEDTKPPAPSTPTPTKPAEDADKSTDVDNGKPPPRVITDGVIGQLEVHRSGAVKMRLGDGIVLDVTAATQSSFLQHAVHVDLAKKRLCVLGEVNKRFVVSPDVDMLLADAARAETKPDGDADPEIEGLIVMDTS